MRMRGDIVETHIPAISDHVMDAMYAVMSDGVCCKNSKFTGTYGGV